MFSMRIAFLTSAIITALAVPAFGGTLICGSGKRATCAVDGYTALLSGQQLISKCFARRLTGLRDGRSR